MCIFKFIYLTIKKREFDSKSEEENLNTISFGDPEMQKKTFFIKISYQVSIILSDWGG